MVVALVCHTIPEGASSPLLPLMCLEKEGTGDDCSHTDGDS